MTRKILAILVLAVMVGALAAPRQAQAQQAPEWKTVCKEEGKPETCQAIYEMFLARQHEDGKLERIGRWLRVTVAYQDEAEGRPRVPYMELLTPLGVDLRPGAVAQIDKGEQISMPFLQCTQAGCELLLRLDERRVRNLKAGANLRIGFRPLGSTEINIVNVSLVGFSKAFRSLN